MFSGGLDSLAGAVDTAARGGKLVLVSHRPVTTQYGRQRQLFEQLKATLTVPMIHVPVWVNKHENLGKEPTQRTRSFLYATLGVAVAASLKAEGVRFFENGASPTKIVEQKGLAQVSDTSAIEQFCDEVIAANPKSAADFKAGKVAALNFLKGQVMKASKGKANPNLVGEILERKLKR